MSETALISVDDITIDTTQARRGEWLGDELDQQLVDSITGIGLIHDIIVRLTTTEKYGGETEKPYALVAGSRRYHALIEAGIYEIPCKILDLEDCEAISMSFNENVGRKDLTWYQTLVAITTWIDLLKQAGMNEQKAILEIANTSFGGNSQRIYVILRTHALPPELQILIKQPEERTKEEIHILKEYDIPPNFKLDFQAMSTMKGIVDQLEDLKDSEQVDKIFSMIGKLKLADEPFKKRYEILGSIRDKLEKGMDFDIVIGELKEEMMVFEMVRVKDVRFKIPEDYDLWHKRACERAGLKGKKLAQQVYLSWLENEARREGW